MFLKRLDEINEKDKISETGKYVEQVKSQLNQEKKKKTQ